MGLADQSVMREQAIEAELTDDRMAHLNTILETLVRDATRALTAQGVPSERNRVLRRVHLRYEGTDSALVVHHAAPAQMQRQFESTYRSRFGFIMPGRALVAEAVSVEVIGA